MFADIPKAVDILNKGGIVAMPTETVYGLAADARNPAAIQKIFAAKGRPIDHPLIVHIGDIALLSEWASDISPAALQLAKAFWPGPLTLILKKAPGVLDLITGQQTTIGIRIPNHPIALALLKSIGKGLAAPSANRFGRISPTTAAAVKEELGSAVDFILDGGQCQVGVESTIVDMTGEHPVILRPGMISAQQIADVLDDKVNSKTQDSPRVSGSLASHYAPKTETLLMTIEQLQHLPEDKLMHAVIVARESLTAPYLILMANDPIQYAHDLYLTLRELDKQGFKQILIQTVPDTADWDAIRDRLQRAAKAF